MATALEEDIGMLKVLIGGHWRHKNLKICPKNS